MKRRVMTFLLTAAMLASMCACSKSEESSKAANNGTAVSAENGGGGEPGPESESETEASEQKGEQSILHIQSGISEERLWVSFGEIESQDVALIDTEGKVLFVSPKYIQDFSEVHNGVTFVTIYTPGSGDNKNDFYVLDCNGNEIKKFSKDSTRYDILAADRGYCAVYEFSGTSHKIYIVDSKGDIVASKDIADGKSEWLQITSSGTVKAGDGIYVVRYYDEAAQKTDLFMVNFNVPNIVHAETEKRVKFRLGSIVIEGYDDSDYYQALPIEAYTDDSAFAAALDKVFEGEKYHTTGEDRNLYDIETAKKGATIKYYYEDNGTNYLINEMCTLDGYVYLALSNFDLSEGFYVVLDLEGNKLYDVKPTEDNMKIIDMDNGCLLLSDGVILTTGEKVAYDKLPSGFTFKNDHYFGHAYYSGTGDRGQREFCMNGVFGREQCYGGIFGGYMVPRADSNVDGEASYANQFQKLDGSGVVSTIKF